MPKPLQQTTRMKSDRARCEPRRWPVTATRRRGAFSDQESHALGLDLLTHDLGQPLAALHAGGELLDCARDQMSAEGNEALDALQAATLRLSHLVETLRAQGTGRHTSLSGEHAA